MKTCDSSLSGYAKKEAKFRKSLRSFLTFNVIIFAMMIFGMGGAVLWKISVIWGAILAFKGYGLYGCEEKAERDIAVEEELSSEQYGRPKRPQWKDKDLV